MRRFYQESWQGIPFTAVSHISFFRLASTRFYSVFYEELFRRYKSWDDLPAQWRESKLKDAEWLAEQIREKKSKLSDSPEPFRVLSIGSGVGFMEKALVEKAQGIKLHINEPSTVGLKWIRKVIPAERIYIGSQMECLPPDIHYDLIYLSAVDYGISQSRFIRQLESLKAQLKPGGEIICISASLLQEDSFIGSLVNCLKIVIRFFLHYLGIRPQQFWGWRRTRAEYRAIFKEVGLKNITDGFIDDGFESYWIRGK